MVLQQCAHFYNNIATEMIPCQKPMMLAEAVEFEKVCQGMCCVWVCTPLKDITNQNPDCIQDN
jgi:hypothetical protein